MMKIHVREAVSSDMPWMSRLMVESSVYNVPYGRDVANQSVKETTHKAFAELVEDDAPLLILVAETDQADPMGLLVLLLGQYSETTGELQSEIYNLAVQPKYWGTSVVSKLVVEATKASDRLEHPFMIGQVTADNRRMALKIERIGAELEAYEIVVACDANGMTSMPGRPESQRAHDVSRAQRKLLTQRKARRARRQRRGK